MGSAWRAGWAAVVSAVDCGTSPVIDLAIYTSPTDTAPFVATLDGPNRVGEPVITRMINGDIAVVRAEGGKRQQPHRHDDRQTGDRGFHRGPPPL
jgi:hypothetical protein